MTRISDRTIRGAAHGGIVLAAMLLAACGGSDDGGDASGSASYGGPTSRLPTARSALVPPDITTPCTITRSAIERFDVKGSGLAFGGASFGDAGTYTYTLAEATATVAPADECAGTIVDLKNAVPDVAGNVRYRFDVVLLAPTDPARANGTLFYEVTNRTRSLLVPALNEGSANDLFAGVRPQVVATASGGDVAGVGAGNGFLMNQGASIVWAGWQGDQPQTLAGPSAAITAAQRWYAPGMTLPVAVDRANGDAPITGRVQDELVADNATANLLGTYYKMAPGTLATATLTVRRTPTSAPVTVARSKWTYTAGTATAPAGGTGADGYGFVTIDRAAVRADAANAPALDAGRDDGSIYQFDYTAVEPRVMGLGFLATRDLVSFLRHGTIDAAGNRNPLAGRVRTTLFGGISQSGRYVRDYLWQGFNADAQNRRVFDGMFPLVGGSRKTYTNYRWSKPGDYARQHETHYTPGDQFPFGYATLTDPVSGRTDGLLAKCTRDATCPKVVQYDSPIEFGGARLLVATDGAGNDVAVPENVRLFYANGTQHSPSALAANARTQPDMTTNRAVAATAPTYAPNVLNASTALVRALYLNLEGWVQGTAQPLPSVWPSVRGGTLAVPTVSVASLGGPDLSAVAFTGVAGTPGLSFNGVYNTLSLNDESVIPSAVSSKLYVVQLPTLDAQGNDVAGVKMPDSAVPLATFKGYSLRRPGFVAGDQYGLNGSQLAFAVTDAQRQPGDPRRSVQSLYGSKAGYVDAVDRSVANLVARGLMLDGRFGADDAVAYRARARSQSLQPGFAALP